uniref:Uncharacterized protein LOC114342055 n=1 Tax=Diabrotica virgifera virgifera TaxID=50390 RepID=A0A6P7GXU5_DIAVI
MSDCHACGKTIPSNDSSSLVCLQCKRPWHGVCAEPQPTDGDSTTLRNWKCFRCVSPSGDIETSHFNAIMAQFTILNSALTDCKTQINNLTDLVSAQSQIISTCVADISDLRKENQSLNNNLKALENKVIKLENKNVPTTSESVFQESYERLKRSENIIITGVPESNNTEDDISKASEILENVIPKNHFQIKSAARLGKIDLNKPRVFRITLNPICLNEQYKIISIPAVKEKSLGRPSGGLCVVYKKTLGLIVLHQCSWWLFMLIDAPCEKYIVCNLYFKPSFDIEHMLNLFQCTLNEITNNYSDCAIIIGGDFNSHLGTLGSIPDEIISNTSLYETRLSRRIH